MDYVYEVCYAIYTHITNGVGRHYLEVNEAIDDLSYIKSELLESVSRGRQSDTERVRSLLDKIDHDLFEYKQIMYKQVM